MTRDCQIFSERLDDFLDGVLPADEQTEMRTHASSCAGCAELLRLSAEEPGDLEFATPADLTGMILDHTSGPVCDSAHLKLVDHVDAQLEAVDDEILQLHLVGCDDCNELATVLKRLPLDLPLLAEMEPDGRFVDEILSRTSQHRPPVRRWASILAEQWQRMLQRPRLAWEGAYLSTCLLMLIMGGPVSALTTVSTMADNIREIDTEAILVPVDRLEQGLVNGAGSAWENTSGTVTHLWNNTTTQFTGLSSTTYLNLKEATGTFLDQFASDTETQTIDPPQANEDHEQGEQE
jgi:hypothetical protein